MHRERMDVSANSTLSQVSDDLINRYVGICNEALLQNRNRFPFKQILGAARESEKDRPVEVCIKDNGSSDTYVFRLKDSGIIAAPHDSCKGCDCVRSWNVSANYLEDVVKDPQSYIQNPAKLDWEWMYDI